MSPSHDLTTPEACLSDIAISVNFDLACHCSVRFVGIFRSSIKTSSNQSPWDAANILWNLIKVVLWTNAAVVLHASSHHFNHFQSISYNPSWHFFIFNFISGPDNVSQFCINHQATLSACSHWQNATRRSQTVCNRCFQRRNGMSKALTYHQGRSRYVIKISQVMSNSGYKFERSARNPATSIYSKLRVPSYCCPGTNHKARIELQTLGRTKTRLTKGNHKILLLKIGNRPRS